MQASSATASNVLLRAAPAGWPAAAVAVRHQQLPNRSRYPGPAVKTVISAAAKDYYTSNLGVLAPVVEQPSGSLDDPYAMQRVSPDSFSSRGYYLDGTAIFGSAVLLVVLLGLTFERILGLDRLINGAILRWKESRQYQRRNQVIDARQRLEDSWESDDNIKP